LCIEIVIILLPLKEEMVLSAKFWRYLFILYVALLFILSVWSKPVVDYNKFPGEDKLIHFGAYFLGTILFERARNGKMNKLLRVIIVFFIIMPIITELIQSFYPDREMNLLDALSGYAGIIVGWFFMKKTA